MKLLRYTSVIVFVLCSCNKREDHAASKQSSGSEVEVVATLQVSEEEFVKLSDILPIKVMYEPMGKGGGGHFLQISDDKIELQIFRGGGLVTIATMPARPHDLEAAIQGVRKDYFRGKVYYSNPYVRDGGKRHMITPLGDISEYGVFQTGSIGGQTWPQAILSLEPLFDLHVRWAMELEKLEVAQGKPAEQDAPSNR